MLLLVVGIRLVGAGGDGKDRDCHLLSALNKELGVHAQLTQLQAKGQERQQLKAIAERETEGPSCCCRVQRKGWKARSL